IVTTEQGTNLPFHTFNPNVKFHDLGINYNRDKSYFKIKNFLKILKNLLELKKLLKNLKPDLLIIANNIPASFFFPFLNTKAKVLKEYHNTQYFKSKAKHTFFKKLENYIESKLDYQIVLSEEEKSFFSSP